MLALLRLTAVATFALTALPVVFAQPGVIPRSGHEARGVEITVEVLEQTASTTGTIAICAKHEAAASKLYGTAASWGRIAGNIDQLGKVLAIRSATESISEGQTIQGTQTMAMALADQAMCQKQWMHLCVPWMVGRTVGEVLNYLPLAAGADRTINIWWTDTLAEWWFAGRPVAPSTVATRLKAMSEKARRLEQNAIALGKRCEADSKVDEALSSVLGRASSSPAVSQGRATRLDALAADGATSSSAGVARAQERFGAELTGTLRSEAERHTGGQGVPPRTAGGAATCDGTMQQGVCFTNTGPQPSHAIYGPGGQAGSAQGGRTCPATLGHLGNALPRFADSQLQALREQILRTDVQAEYRKLAATRSPQQIVSQAQERAAAHERGAAQAEECVRRSTANAEAVLATLRSGGSELATLPKGISDGCAKAYVVFHYGVVANREVASAVTCMAR